jgi:hypothetical protein
MQSFFASALTSAHDLNLMSAVTGAFGGLLAIGVVPKWFNNFLRQIIVAIAVGLLYGVSNYATDALTHHLYTSTLTQLLQLPVSIFEFSVVGFITGAGLGLSFPLPEALKQEDYKPNWLSQIIGYVVLVVSVSAFLLVELQLMIVKWNLLRGHRPSVYALAAVAVLVSAILLSSLVVFQGRTREDPSGLGALFLVLWAILLVLVGLAYLAFSIAFLVLWIMLIGWAVLWLALIGIAVYLGVLVVLFWAATAPKIPLGWIATFFILLTVAIQVDIFLRT